MGALLGGIVAIVIGIWLWIIWDGQIIVIQGSVPIMIILGGLLAVIAGITSIKDSIEAKKLEKETQTSQQPSTEQK